MELLQTMMESMLALGAPIVLPIIMIVIAFVANTGLELTAIDLGWTPTAAIAWAWPYAFLMFPLQITINIVMLAFNWTQCLNVDMWNVWNKVLTGVLVSYVSGSVAMGFIVAAIQVVVELKQADWSVHLVEEGTGIPGVSLPHSLFFEWIIFAPLNRLLDKIPVLRDNHYEPEVIREKIGIFGENHVIGFLVGCLIAVMARYDLRGVLGGDALHHRPNAHRRRCEVLHGRSLPRPYLPYRSGLAFHSWYVQLVGCRDPQRPGAHPVGRCSAR